MARLPVVCVVALLCIGQAVAMTGIVSTTLGDVQGQEMDGYSQFLGIPFAASTAEENRFMPPQPRSPWDGVYDATSYGPGCMQGGTTPNTPQVMSEDCLTVDAYTPEASASSGLPVIVWLFGGAFINGFNEGPFNLYDGGRIISPQAFGGTGPNRKVVVAACNYRLTVFGWLVAGSASGNQGFLDQQMCMQWVQDNIKQFGGDPSRVTLAGESAGAMSVGLHLISPSSAGLFQQALMASNPAGFRYRDPSSQEDYGDKACSLLGCKDVFSSCNITCMQHAPAEEVLQQWSVAAGDKVVLGEANWGYWLEAALGATPTVDGTLIPETVQSALAAGNFQPGVNVLIGSNTNEGTTFVYGLFKDPLDKIEYDGLMLGIFGLDASEQIKAQYAQYETSDTRDVLSMIITDFWFRCASERFAEFNVGAANYVYRYNHPNFSGARIWPQFGLPEICTQDRTCHMADLVMEWGFISYPAMQFTMTPAEKALATNIQNYWVNFATNGDPNTGLPVPLQWPQYDTQRPNIIWQEDMSTESMLDNCEFWDGIGYDF